MSRVIVAFILAVLIVDRVCAQQWVEVQQACGIRVSGHDLVTVADGTYLLGGLGEAGYNSRALVWGGAGFSNAGGGFGAIGMAATETADGVWVCGGWNGSFVGMTPVVFTGASWYAPETMPGPTDRMGARAAFFPGLGVVMFGGYERTWWGSTATDETWFWTEQDGVAGAPDLSSRFEWVWWDQPAQGRAVAHSWREHEGLAPAARAGHVMKYVPEFGGVLLFGGETGFYGSEMADVWLFDGEVWREVHAGSGPSRRSDAAAAAWGGGLLIQGGNGPECGFSVETWLLRPDGWVRLEDGPSKAGHSMAVLPDGRPIIYGGIGTLGYYSAWVLTD